MKKKLQVLKVPAFPHFLQRFLDTESYMCHFG